MVAPMDLAVWAVLSSSLEIQMPKKRLPVPTQDLLNQLSYLLKKNSSSIMS